ncbi:MAG: dethiobiotin synthase [Verrucomicrobiota bacterium]|nr:dethiobiotin synthase [Verrucomicrobiota bacterium]
MPTVFITGIDTNVGKSYATGLLAAYLQNTGKSVITQKISQTGCKESSEDIDIHRQIMEIPLQNVDKTGLTCPYIFEFPASPHLSASLENKQIDVSKIALATSKLQSQYEYVIIEGVGGLCVPLTRDLLLLDYVTEKNYPIIIVTSAKLGSINHTLMTLEIAASRGISVQGMIYNEFIPSEPEIISDSINIFSDYMKKLKIQSPIISIPTVKTKEKCIPDFSSLIEELRN